MIVIVAKDGAKLKQALVSNAPSPVHRQRAQTRRDSE